MDKDIITPVLIGAVLGGMIGFASKTVKKHKQEVNNLGHEWTFVKADPNMTSALYNLKSFRHADEQTYYHIGQSCNQLVSLWLDINNPEIRPQEHWAFKSFEYRTEVEKQLQKLAEKVGTCKRPAKFRIKKHDKTGIFEQFSHKEEDVNVNMDEFREYADQLCTIVQNYDYNIRIEIQSRLFQREGYVDYFSE
jgi:hypothetical protein